jgi:hypothetical protein
MGVKWHPGHYVESDMIDGITGAWNISSAKREIDAGFSNPNVLGYQMMITWAVVEPTQGAYDFSDIDALRSYIATKYPDKRFSVLFIEEDPFHPDPGRVVPSYILEDSTYGPAGPNGQYGYAQLKNGSTAAWYRASIAGRIIALMQAFSGYTSPYATGDYTYDSDPYFEAVVFAIENAMSLDPTPSDFRPADAVAQWEAIAAATVAAWRHTNVLDTNNWLATGNSEAQCGAIMLADGNIGVSLSGPDVVAGRANWSWGQLTYTGNATGSGYSINEIGTFPFDAIVADPDYPLGSLESIFSTATSRDPATGFGAARIWWALDNLGDGVPGDWATNVSPFISANPIPSANFVCPATYTTNGGCVTP